MPFTFLHAADLHLDTPFTNVSGFPERVGEALREASLQAWAGLVEEAAADGRVADPGPVGTFGEPMIFDHRRILATAIARLRSKLKKKKYLSHLNDPIDATSGNTVLHLVCKYVFSSPAIPHPPLPPPSAHFSLRAEWNLSTRRT